MAKPTYRSFEDLSPEERASLDSYISRGSIPRSTYGAAPESTEEPGGFVDDMQRGLGQIVKGVGSTLRDTGLDVFGGAVEGYGDEVIRRNPSEINTFGDVLDKPGTTLREAVGEQVPQLGAYLGSAAAGARIGALLGPWGAAAGSVVGGLAPIFAQEYGHIRSDQREQGIDDKGRALMAAVPATALERLGVESAASKILKDGALDLLARKSGSSLGKHVVKQTGLGAVVEGPLTELPQTALGRWGAFKELDTPEAYDEYAVSTAKGSMAGGTFRGGMSAFAGEYLTPEQKAAAVEQARADQQAAQEAERLRVEEDRLQAIAEMEAEDQRKQQFVQDNAWAFQNENVLTPSEFRAKYTEASKKRTEEYKAFENSIAEAYDALVAEQGPVVGYSEFRAQQLEGRAKPKQAKNEELDALYREYFNIANTGTRLDENGNPYQLIQMREADNPGLGGQPVGLSTEGQLSLDLEGTGNVDPREQLYDHESRDFQATSAANPAQIDQMGLGYGRGVDTYPLLPTLDQEELLRRDSERFENQQGGVSGYRGPLTTDVGSFENVVPKRDFPAVPQSQTRDYGTTEQTPEAFMAEQGIAPPNPVAPTVVTPQTAQTKTQKQQGYVPTKQLAEQVLVQAEATPLSQDTQEQVNELLTKGNRASVVKAQEIVQIAAKPAATEQPAPAELTSEQKLAAGWARVVSDGKETWVPPAVAKQKGAGRVNKLDERETALTEADAATEDSLRGWADRVVKSASRNVGIMSASKLLGLSTVEMGTAGPEQQAQIRGLVEHAQDVVRDYAAGNITARDAGASLGVSPMTVQNVVNTVRSKINQTASDNGYTPDYLFELAGIEPEEGAGVPQRTISTAQAAQEGLSYRKGDGPKRVNAESDEFDPTFGYERDEVKDEDGNDVDTTADQTIEDAQFEAYDEAGFDPLEAVHAEQVYAAWAEVNGMPDAASLTVDQLEAVIDAVSKWDGVSVRYIGNRLEGILNDPSLSETGEGTTETEPGGSGQTSRGETTADESIGDEPAYAAPVPTKQATVSVRKKRTVVKPTEEAAPVGQQQSNAEQTQGAEGLDGKQFSKGDTTKGTTKQAIEKVLADLTGKTSNVRVHVFQNEQEAVAAGLLTSKEANGKVQAWVEKGHAYFILGNIPAGNELAVFLHEVGAHIGLENILTQTQYQRLVNQINEWAKRNDGSKEAKIAKAALERVAKAQTKEGDVAAEEIAYFIEEAVKAGIDPTANDMKSQLGRFLAEIVRAFRTALMKLGINPNSLTAQDVVNLAYGAAHKELNVGVSNPTATGALHSVLESAGKYATLLAETLKNFNPEAKRKLDEQIRTNYRKFVVRRNHRKLWDIQGYKPNPATVAAFFEGLVFATAGAKTGFMAENAVPLYVHGDDPTYNIVYWDTVISNGEGHEFNGVYTVSGKTASGDMMLKVVPAVYGDMSPTLLSLFNNIDKAINSTVLEQIGDSAFEVQISGPSEGSTAQKLLNKSGVTTRTPYTTEDGEPYHEYKVGYETTQQLGNLIFRALWLDRGADANADFSITWPQRDTGANPSARSKVWSSSKVQKRFSRSSQPISSIPQDKIKETVSKLPASLQTPALRIATTIKDLATRGLYGAAFGHDLANIIGKHLPGADAYFKQLAAAEATEMEFASRVDDIMIKAYNVKDKAALKAFLKKSTRSQKWGFAPSWDAKAVVDAGMKAEFDALSEDAQDVAKRMFEHGHRSREELRKIVKENIEAGFADVDKAAMTPAELKKHERRRLKQMRLFDKQFGQLQGPYAPLSRFGNHVAVWYSQEYLAAKNSNDTKRMEELEDDPNHKAVFFADSLGEARVIAEEAASHGMESDYFTKELYYSQVNEAPWAAIQRLQTMVREELGDGKDSKYVAKINSLLKDLYLTTAAEASARRHELKRRNIEGASDDMLRAFATKGRADAHFIAALKNQGKINTILSDLKGHVAKQRGKADSKRALNEILARHAMGMEYKHTPFQDKAMALTSFWMLLTNPRYYVANAMQTAMISVPYMAGRFGYGKTWTEVNRAYKELATGFGNLKGFAAGEFSIDAVKVPDDAKQFLRDMKNAGKLDIGINMDLGIWEAGDSKAQQAVAHLSHATRNLARQVEVVNRVSAGLAAWRLAKQEGKSNPMDYAVDVINRTHGDYSRMAAPRWVNTLPKVMTQFMKYKLIQWSLMARLGHDMFAGASKEEKQAARKAFGFMMGHSAVMTGAMATPPAFILMAILGAIGGDDDDPRDTEEKARAYIGDKTMADLLLRGVPAAAGADISKYVGWEGVVNPVPFVSEDPLTRRGYAESAVGLMGPFIGGLAPKFIDGIGLMANGDYYKGLEKFLPTLPSNALKGFREANEGITRKNGDIVLSAEEMTFFDAMMQTLGVPTTKSSDANRNLNWGRKNEQYFQDRSRELTNKYAAAYRKRDNAEMASIREDWMNMAAMQRELGMKPAKLSSLYKAPQNQMKREQEIAEMVDEEELATE